MEQKIEREEIVEFVKNFAFSKDYVFALWLEGADGIGKVDEYSDIDFWFDVKKEYQESFLYECVEELKKLGEFDSRVDDISTEIAQSNVHLKNTSEYLTLDLCVQSHEVRGLEMTCFSKDDIAERPLVLFDKANIITYRETSNINKEELQKTFEKSKNRILQSSRVMKYIKRNQYPEAFMKYIENVADPIVMIARIIYTPTLLDYGLCHISDHLPKEIVSKIEPLYKVSSFEDFERNIELAKSLLELFEKEYNFKI